MAVDVLDARVYKTGHLADIAMPMTDGTQILTVCDEGVIFTESGTQTYQPRIAAVGDIILDDNGMVRTWLRLSMRGPYWDDGMASGARHDTISDYFQFRGTPLGGAITIYERAWIDASAAQQTKVLATGTVVRVGEIGPTGVTLYLELRGDMEPAKAPIRKIVAGEVGGTVEDGRIPDSNVGEAYPLSLGRAVAYKGPTLSGVTDSSMIESVSISGIRPTLFPMIMIQKDGTNSRYAWTEKIFGGLVVENVGAGDNEDERKMFSYFQSLDAYGIIWESGSNVVFDGYATPWNSLAYTITVPEAPYFRIPILAASVHSDSTQLYDGEHAIDGKSDTYATLGYGGKAYFDLPSNLPRLGRLSLNTTNNGSGLNDIEGTAAPNGLQVRVMLVSPTGTAVASQFLSVGAALVYPFTTTPLNAGIASFSPPGSNGTATFSSTSIRVADASGNVNAPGTGWLGSKFQNFDFTNAPKDVSPDRGLYDSGNNLKTGPFRIEVQNNTSVNQVPIFIASACLLVSFQPNFIPGAEAMLLKAAGNAAERRNRKTRKTFTEIMLGLATENIADYADAEQWYWSRSSGPGGGSRSRTSTRELVPSPDNVYVSTSSYRDDGSGTYTGTINKTLAHPVDNSAYLIQVYGGQTRDITAFGSWIKARQDVDRWARYANGNSSNYAWTFRMSVSDSTELSVLASEVLAELPETVAVKSGNGSDQWCCHTWIPWIGVLEQNWTNKLYRSGDPIVPQDVVIAGDERLEFDIGTTDISSVVNKLRIQYDYDIGAGKFRRVATCSPDTSDDGYGNPWPATPENGAGAEEICRWSQIRYGSDGSTYRPREREIQLHTINDPVLAVAVGLYHLWRFYRVGITMKFTGTQAWHDLEPFQIFRFSTDLKDKFYFPSPLWGQEQTTPLPDDGHWDQLYWRCTHIERRVADNGARTYEIAAEWMPQIIGGEVAAGAGGDVLTDDAILSL